MMLYKFIDKLMCGFFTVVYWIILPLFLAVMPVVLSLVWLAIFVEQVKQSGSSR